MDVTTTTRATGTYAIRATGMQNWATGDDTWQAPGVRVQLMHGATPLASIKLEAPASKADDVAQEIADGITPWVKTLRALSIVANLRKQLAMAESLALRADDEAQWGLLSDDTYDEIAAIVQEGDTTGPIGADACRQVAARLRQQIAQGQRLALAHAPDGAARAIHPEWKLPALAEFEGGSLARTVASELLAGWAAVRDQRDELITWAVRDAGVTRTEVQQITSVSRSTINRLLPTA